MRHPLAFIATLLLIFLCLGGSSSAGQAVSYAPTMPPWRLQQELQNANIVVGNGLRAMRGGLQTVAFKDNIPQGVNPQAYRSLAPEWWPNPATTDGLPYIQRVGLNNPMAVSNDYDAARLQRFTETIHSLVLLFRLTGDKEAAQRAASLLRAWFITPESRMLPDMQTAHIKPTLTSRKDETGKTNSFAEAKGSAEGLIEARYLITLCNSMALLHDERIWTAQDKAAVARWFSDFRHWHVASAFGTEHARMSNHHGTWDDAVQAALALFLGDTDSARNIITSRSLPRVAEQFLPDGTQPKELVRKNSLHYSIVNMEAWVLIAIMGQRVGVDVWQYKAENGASLADGWQLLRTCRKAPQSWPWRQEAELDLARLDRLELIIQGLGAKERAAPEEAAR